jgi:hypothetical protein
MLRADGVWCCLYFRWQSGTIWVNLLATVDAFVTTIVQIGHYETWMIETSSDIGKKDVTCYPRQARRRRGGDLRKKPTW